LIASLLDTNNDHVVSVGDRIHWGTYPTTSDVDGPRGNFTGPDLLVEGVSLASSGGVEVQTALGNVAWAQSGGTRAFDLFATAGGDSIFGLDTTSGAGDSFFANPSVQGPGQPDTPVDTFNLNPVGNQGFLDVLIFI
jgi:hypothetical protein